MPSSASTAAAGSQDGADPASQGAHLVERILAGDEAAEAELVQTYGRQLTFLLRRWCRDEDVAQELYQETFRRALEKIRGGDVRQPDRLAAFLRALAKNLSTYYYRRDDRRSVWHEETEDGWEAPDPTPGLLSGLLQEERAQTVRRVLQDLGNARDREILTRYYLAEQTKDVICRELDLGEDHFKRVLFRARQRYKRLYEAQALQRAAL